MKACMNNSHGVIKSTFVSRSSQQGLSNSDQSSSKAKVDVEKGVQMRAPKGKMMGKVELLIVVNQSVDIVDVAHGVQTRATTGLDFFAPGMYYTSYLNMQHFSAGHIFFVLTRAFARFH